MRAYGTGAVISRPGTNKLYIRYRVNGKQVQEATGSSEPKVAEHLLRQRVESAQKATIQGKRVACDGNALLFIGGEIQTLSQPCAYAFYYKGECLYIGRGKSCSRPFSVRHHRRSELAHADESMCGLGKRRY